MKTIKHIAILVMLSLFAACQEGADSVKNEAEITYEVTTVSGNWFGEYRIETGEKICNCSSPLLTGGWKHTFKVSKPFKLHIDATTDSPLYGTNNAPDVTTIIYVDGKQVAANTSNWTKGAASADFEVK